VRHLDTAVAAATFRAACRYDVLALKPGNVALDRPAHGMNARDFLRSAAVAAEPAADPSRGLGASIEAAIAATLATVGCNTNLGIVLLCVPLLHAAALPAPLPALQPRVARVLAGSTVTDTAHVFRAIRQANPAGLGQAPDGDVRGLAIRPLREIMTLAAGRDLVAAQYANEFATVFARGVPALCAGLALGQSLVDAVTDCYLDFLAGYPDSHVARKHGLARATAVQARARRVTADVEACEDPTHRRLILEAFDRELKEEGVNPGTSADLTVASLVAWWLETSLLQEASAAARTVTHAGDATTKQARKADSE
jgi:triphosphoribosyl-dephospho-CoA synthase